MWVYQCLDILSTVVEMACLYIISGILLKESRFHTSLCKYISPIIMFMVTWILTWFSGLGAFKMPIIFIVAFTVLQVSYKESIYQTVIAIEIWFICCIFLVEAFVYPVSKFIFNNMPGVLWKKFDSMEVAGNLAFIGSIKDDVLDIEALATALLGEMQRMYPERLAERYRLTAEELGQDAYDLLETVGRKRGMLMSGGVVNTERAAITLVDEFRGAKLGRVSLERPEEA